MYYTNVCFCICVSVSLDFDWFTAMRVVSQSDGDGHLAVVREEKDPRRNFLAVRVAM